VVTRRTLLRGAGVTLAAGSPVLLAACGDKGDESPRLTGPPDAAVLNSMLDLEHATAAAYQVSMPHLRGESLRAAGAFLAQERAHAAALARSIHALGAAPNRPKATYGFPTVTSEAAAFNLLTTLENTTIATYRDAIAQLGDRDLRAKVAAIFTTEAEHVAVLDTLQGKEPSPRPFVTGQP
jgi:rubrerythrin